MAIGVGPRVLQPELRSAPDVFQPVPGFSEKDSNWQPQNATRSAFHNAGTAGAPEGSRAVHIRPRAGSLRGAGPALGPPPRAAGSRPGGRAQPAPACQYTLAV